MNCQHLALVLTLSVLGTGVAVHYGFYGRHGHHRPFGHHGRGGRFLGGGGSPGGTIGGNRFPGGGGSPGGTIGGSGGATGSTGVGGSNTGSNINRPAGGSCPPVRTGCTASRSQPVMCSTDSQCLAGRKCCFDSCVQTEVCKATV